MNKLFKTCLFVGTCIITFQSQANQEGLTCLGKQSALNTEIDYAKNYNSHRVRGLENALKEVQNYCNDQDLEIKYKNDILDKLKKLQEKQIELNQAKLKNKPSKINKIEKKIAVAEVELKNAQEKLDSFYKALNLEKQKNL
ncbi:DUF1090 domain-containing protein [Orbaceae bacterium ac157xtp]